MLYESDRLDARYLKEKALAERKTSGENFRQGRSELSVTSESRGDLTNRYLRQNVREIRKFIKKKKNNDI